MGNKDYTLYINGKNWYDVVHECETEFEVFPVTDIIETKKKKIYREIRPLR